MDVISLLVLLVVFSLGFYIIQLLPLLPPLKNIAMIIFLLFCMLYLLGGLHHGRLVLWRTP